MRLVDRLLGGPEAEVARSSDYFFNPFAASYGAPDEEKVLPNYLNNANAYGSSSVVFGVELARMSLFTEAEFKFQRLVDKSLFGTPDLYKLENPWPNGTTGELLARMEQDAALAGNAYIRDAGSQLERLRPDWVTIVSQVVIDPVSDTEVRRVIGFLYDPIGDFDREAAFYPVDEVAHWSPLPDPLANFRGMSWLTPVLREVDADAQMTEYKRAFLTNAATPNLAIRYSAKIGPDKLQRLSAQLQAKHGGVGNAFKTLVLDEGADLTVMGNSFDQMRFDQVQSAGENRIAVAAGVPAIVAGLKEGLEAATYSNYELAMRRFADLTMRPLWRSACGALAKLVPAPEGTRLWYDTTDIAALRQGNKDQADTMAVLATAANALVMAGYTPVSINAALSSGDITLLKHSGLVSVQMQHLQGEKDQQTTPITSAGATGPIGGATP